MSSPFVDDEMSPSDPAILWSEIRSLRRESAHWRTKYQAEKQERERLEADLAAIRNSAQEATP